MKAQKTVQVLVTYTFKHVNRVCFTVLASNGTDKYNTCFDNGNASCTCDGFSEYHKECYHIKQLRPRYDAIMAKREATRTREQALAKAQAESAELLASIECETLAAIEAEQAQPGRPRSEQARIGDVMDAPKASTFEALKNRYDVRSTSEPVANPSTLATNMVIEAKRRQEAPLAGASRAFSILR